MSASVTVNTIPLVNGASLAVMVPSEPARIAVSPKIGRDNNSTTARYIRNAIPATFKPFF